MLFQPANHTIYPFHSSNEKRFVPRAKTNPSTRWKNHALESATQPACLQNKAKQAPSPLPPTPDRANHLPTSIFETLSTTTPMWTDRAISLSIAVYSKTKNSHARSLHSLYVSQISTHLQRPFLSFPLHIPQPQPQLQVLACHRPIIKPSFLFLFLLRRSVLPQPRPSIPSRQPSKPHLQVYSGHTVITAAVSTPQVHSQKPQVHGVKKGVRA